MAQLLKMKVIKPKILTEGLITDPLVKEFKTSADRVEKNFKKTIATWKNQPKFEKEFEFGSTQWRYRVFTTNQVYAWVNDGTEPHPIEAKKKGGVLFYPYKGTRVAKTKPGRLSSGSGKKGRNKIVSPMWQPVQHPGVKARKFDEMIAEKETPKLMKYMNVALAKSIKKSKHVVS